MSGCLFLDLPMTTPPNPAPRKRLPQAKPLGPSPSSITPTGTAGAKGHQPPLSQSTPQAFAGVPRTPSTSSAPSSPGGFDIHVQATPSVATAPSANHRPQKNQT